jgi:hypothetical protein
MGADMYLESVLEPFLETYSGPRKDLHPANALAEIFRALAASGGYFRNGYNCGDIMWAMGLSWSAVGDMLDEQHYLPIDRAKELIAMVEGRPFTEEMVARHYLQNLMEESGHPVSGPAIKALQRAEPDTQSIDGVEIPEPPDFMVVFDFVTGKREELLALLRKSIALNEPLRCSV